MKETGMRELSQLEVSMVSAGEVACASGGERVPCPGSADYSHATDRLIGALADLMEKVADWWNN
jgi:hypothetical protein